jgi:Prp8 binding protein
MTDLRGSCLRQPFSAKVRKVYLIALGHDAEVHSVKFSECGDYMASAGYDKKIMIWKVFDPTFKNVMELKAHKNGILDI